MDITCSNHLTSDFEDAVNIIASYDMLTSSLKAVPIDKTTVKKYDFCLKV